MCCYSKHVNAVLYNWWLDIASHFLTHFLMVDISGCFLCSAWEKLCINRKAICGKMISNKPSFCLLSETQFHFQLPLYLWQLQVCVELIFDDLALIFHVPNGCIASIASQMNPEYSLSLVMKKSFLNMMRACLHLLLCCQWCRWSFLWSTSSFEWRS